MEQPSVIAFLVLFTCVSASVIPDFAERREPEKFKLRITEKGTKFDEEIEIDESKDIEYFTVPAHNEVSATDSLFDFRMNLTVSRLKQQKVCHITPLPPGLPTPNVLKRGLRTMTNLPASHSIQTISQYWRVAEKVDKTILRREVREFCGQFPVYRLESYTRDSVAVEEEKVRERAKRDVEVTEFDVCGSTQPACHPTVWQLRCKFTTSSCVWYMKCKVPKGVKMYTCDAPIHFVGTLLCCDAVCP